jgi:hypothetical protein
MEIVVAVAQSYFALAPSGPAAVVATALLLAHVFGGKPRWQLAGVYAAGVVIAIGVAVDLVAPQHHRKWGSSYESRSYTVPLIRWGLFTIST